MLEDETITRLEVRVAGRVLGAEPGIPLVAGETNTVDVIRAIVIAPCDNEKKSKKSEKARWQDQQLPKVKGFQAEHRHQFQVPGALAMVTHQNCLCSRTQSGRGPVGQGHHVWEGVITHSVCPLGPLPKLEDGV